MAIFVKKSKLEILKSALAKLEAGTSLTATGAGSVVRSFAEAITTELGELYNALDYNTAQTVISTATGGSLDLLGQLYGITRKGISDLATLEASTGRFYFYVDSPFHNDIVIPRGTKVFTSSSSTGAQKTYSVQEQVIIASGKTRAFASIAPNFVDASYAAGIGTVTMTDFISPYGSLVQCTNPKELPPQSGFETDNNYRTRIIKGVRVASSGTVEACRFAGLSVPGVRDVVIRQAPYGMGSVEVMVVPEKASMVNQAALNVQNAMESVRPLGVRFVVVTPRLIPVDIHATILLGSDFQVDPQLNGMAELAIVRYFNSFLPGQILTYNKLIQILFDVSPAIKDVQFTKYAPNGVESIRRNYTPKENEQLIPGNIAISII